MGGYGHVGRLLLQRSIDGARVNGRQSVRVLAASAHHIHLLVGTQIGPHRVIELQISAARVVKCLDRLAPGAAEVVEVGIEVGIRSEERRVGKECRYGWSRYE